MTSKASWGRAAAVSVLVLVLTTAMACKKIGSNDGPATHGTRATVPSGPPGRRPGAATPAPTVTARSSDYVVTPNGLFHRSCVIPLRNNDRLQKDGTVTRDSVTVRRLSPCRYPHHLRDGQRLYAEGNFRPSNDWVAFASKSLDPLQLISARWVVSPAPTRSANQVLYYFPGIEPADGSVIAQPVLQWYSPSRASASGMPAGWSIASWYCCSENNISFSEPVPVQPGDIISGLATGSQCDDGGACASWTITTRDTTTGQGTTFVADKTSGSSVGHPLTWGVGASLEEWFVDPDACDEYPADSETFTDVQAVTTKGASVSPAWDHEVRSVGRECGFKITPGNSITILHGDKAVSIVPGPAGHCLCNGTWPNDCQLCVSDTSPGEH